MAHADMTDSRRQTKAGRPTPGDALALPHVIEAIATSLDNQKDFSSFLHVVPRSLWTPAVTAFLDCTAAMPYSLVASWPRIVLNNIELPPSVLALLAATLPLRPRIQLKCFADANPLASLVTVLGPALNSVMSIDLHNTTVTPRLGRLLAAWLSTAPATKLRLASLDQMDHDGAIAFCDALQANTTLQELAISHVPSLGGFHGRTLPVSLRSLEWNGPLFRVVNVATLTDLATAVGPTQLERLACNVFGLLATYPAAASMLSQLQSLVVSWWSADSMPALIAGLSSVPALTSLDLCKSNLSTSMELFMRTLATTCMHLKTLSVDDDLTRDGSAALLSGVLQLPRLATLDLSMHLLDVLHVLPELVAAGRQLRHLALSTIECDNYDLEKRAICKALAQVHDVPFVLQTLPEDMDKFVVDALSPRADRRHQCDLDFE
ncbi:hypothetical protein SPRG_12998 [Saprolegnia parasitica CBS 223.65]|uniref:RNI-like protein n=1 Tax=Saprolegnia parasitica (strain CBS 223.65) TaxID=695850 RepID=A0A067BXU8_SAPPC|nr:hypothetical protein SPRG_12998 [Saprolegnia parasitica CBS 223.65]KDO21660.1 hypothetical protein SPRG_12998 [Saprolegnia parasitica CBS 223.65]|eukprot:XP_012207584.1 hypothetical protein SPRG_12998 [Saprolegnia parasitica CBS 223.65]